MERCGMLIKIASRHLASDHQFYILLYKRRNWKTTKKARCRQTAGKRRSNEKILTSDRIIFRVTVSAPRGKKMNDPA